MNEIQKEIIKKLVYTFATKADITNEEIIINTINHLCSMNIDDCLDKILVSLDDLLNQGKIKEEDILANENYLTKLNNEKYPTMASLIERLHIIKELNLEYPSMSLKENHELVIEIFTNLNKLLGTRFDCYYTGGLMGYLATNHKLERFHGDLDLFINEEQLMTLKELIDSDSSFSFISNMNRKEETGHEYKIIYKNSPISIGLFLFERQQDNSITTKEYYFENKDTNGQLFVNEHHLSKEYTKMTFSDQIREYDGTLYRMTSLESIYNLKKNSRPKDKYDAKIIKDNIDVLMDSKLDNERNNNFDIMKKPLNKSIIHTIENQSYNTLKI